MTIARVQQSIGRDARRIGGVPLWLVFRALPVLLLVSLALLLLWARPAVAMSRESDLHPGDVESGYMLLRGAGGTVYTPALIQSSKVHFDISGMVAKVVLEQSFRNDSQDWLEGVYAFPLPENSAVRYLEMTVGERRIVGEIREKEAARKIYQAAREQGKKASLVEQQRPNLFTNRVANIGPGEHITVRLEYVQVVDVNGSEFSLRFPMTITPRYMPGQALRDGAEEDSVLQINPQLGWAVPTDQVPDADAISPILHPGTGADTNPLNPIEISARLDMGMPLADVQSPYHQIAMERRAGVYDIRLANGRSEMDRDFVLSWRPVTGSVPSAALFTEQVGQEYFGLLMVVPPAADLAGGAPPREIIIVVDTSGSMGGVSIEQARSSVSLALGRLRPRDRFNIIEFNSTYHALYRTPVPATRHHIQQAQEFVRLLSASGGTEMLPALRAALESTGDPDLRNEQAALRQVIFITDGAVGNETALFDEIAGRLGESRLFTVGIGSAPNSWFMRKAAEVGRGTHTHIGDLHEVGDKMGALFERLSHPAVVDLSVQWPLLVEAWPESLPDLYLGQPLLIAVSFGARSPAGEVAVQGEIRGQLWRRRLQLTDGSDPQSAPGHPGVASLWARQKITGLMDQRAAGRSEEEVRSDVLSVALTHQLLSPYTSFVAVEEVVSRPADKDIDARAVANSRPRGQSPQQFAFPQGATTGPAQLWFGLLLLFFALMLKVMRQGELDHVSLAQL